MNEFKLKVGGVKKFVKEEMHLYAAGDGKRFYVAIHAGPDVERHIVQTKGSQRGFTKIGEAVRFLMPTNVAITC